MTTAAWEQVLDSYEASLNELREWLDGGAGGDMPVGFQPEHEGQLPTELRERAQRLLSESMLLQARLTRMSHQRARERTELTRKNRSRPPLFVDQAG